ncbi:MAG: periplasmic heavy metal sensor [Deltaproteobacteria bacterium]|nr:periplasmic heavy metal sensor [Deltaproteobacteria bacterium]
MRLKKILIIAGAIVLGVVIGAGVVAGVGYHKFFKGDFSHFVISRMDKRMEKLNLSDPQKAQYETLRREMEASLTQGAATKRELMRELRAELNREEPDLEALAALVKTRVNEIPGLVGRNLEHLVEFYATLDKDQKAKMLKHIKKKIERRRFHG